MGEHARTSPPVAPTALVVEADDGARLSALVWGWLDPAAAAPPFLLVHGLASNARLWLGVGAALHAAGHTVVALDQRGHGQSAAAEGADFATLTADLLAVAAAVGLDRPVAVGQSWGGNVVMELARRHPGAVRGVTCVDGGFIELRRRFDDRDAMLDALSPPQLVGTPLDGILAHLDREYGDWPSAGVAGQLANFMVRPDRTVAPHLSRTRHLEILEHLWEHRPTRLWPEIEVPVLLLPVDTGDDPRTGDKRRAVEVAARALPAGEVRWLSGHHDRHAEAPGEVADILRDWAARTTA